MPIRIMISPDKVCAKVKGAWKAGLEELSEEILADCNEYCKVDQNTLIMSSLAASKPKDGKLIWDTPYARIQYWKIKTSLTPGRTWKWCETAKRKHKERWQRLAEKGLRGHL